MNEENEMQIEFKGVLLAILNFLENGETQRAIDYIKMVLSSK